MFTFRSFFLSSYYVSKRPVSVFMRITALSLTVLHLSPSPGNCNNKSAKKANSKQQKKRTKNYYPVTKITPEGCRKKRTIPVRNGIPQRGFECFIRKANFHSHLIARHNKNNKQPYLKGEKKQKPNKKYEPKPPPNAQESVG